LRIAVLVLLAFAAALPARGDGAPAVGGYGWTGWTSRGGVAVSGPDCVGTGAARIACFVRGQDGQLWRRAFDGDEWAPWGKEGGLANAAFYDARPECVSWGPGHVDCFVRRHGDKGMFRRTWAGDYMHSWENLGGVLASDPDCVAKAAERIDCFARGEDGAMWQNAFDGDAWSGWISRGGELADGTKPACALFSAGKIECVVVWSDKRLWHFSPHAPSHGWGRIDSEPVGLPSSESAGANPKCYGAPDAERIECFAPTLNAESRAYALAHLRYDGEWTVDDLGRELGPTADIAHYDFSCVLRAGDRFDCMELIARRAPADAPAGTSRAVSFRHYAYALGGPPAQWSEVGLTMPVDAGVVTFLDCLSADGERIDCFTGGNWRGNSTLNQASYTYQERIVFRPMKPVR